MGSVKLMPVTVKDGSSRSKLTVRGPGKMRSIDSVEPRKVEVVRAMSTLMCRRSWLNRMPPAYWKVLVRLKVPPWKEKRLPPGIGHRAVADQVRA